MIKAVDLITKKEQKFMREYVNMKLEDIYEIAGLSKEAVLTVKGFEFLYEKFCSCLIGTLLTDKEFCELDVVEHYYSNGSDILCLENLNNRQDCEVTASYWLAVTLNAERAEVKIQEVKCYEFERVESSAYRGKTIGDFMKRIMG